MKLGELPSTFHNSSGKETFLSLISTEVSSATRNIYSTPSPSIPSSPHIDQINGAQ